MRSVLVIMPLLLLTGCSKMMGIVETKPAVCTVWKDISWSKSDTPQTIVEVKVNNARREGFCEGKN